MKKILLVLVALFALALLAVVAIPFFVDVDKYRPQVVEQVNQRLNGQLTLGKLSLSLWGQIRIDIEGLKLTDAQGRPVVEVKNGYFHLPFSSVFSGSPSLVLSLTQPELNVVKDKAGHLNVLTLMKTTTPTAGAPASGNPQTSASATPSANGEVKLPGLATRAVLGLELENALVTYKDEAAGMSTQVKDLNVKMENISLSREMTLEITADLDTRMKNGLAVTGPARISARAKPTVSGGRFEQVDVTAHADLDQVAIEFPGLFYKKAGTAAHADLAVSASPSEATISRLDAQFFNVDLKSSGKLTHLADSPQPVVAYQLKSNAIELKSWSELVPMLKDYELGGMASLSAEAHGPADKLVYRAEAKVENFTAKAGKLKAQPRIDADLTVSPDKADLKASMHAPANDLQISGGVVSFTRPQIHLDVTSSGMDLDQLVDFTPPGAKSAPPQPAAGAPASPPPSGPPADLDAMVAPIRENKSLALAQAHLNLNIRSLKAQGVSISDISSKASFQSLVGSIDNFAMKVFGGQIKSTASVDLKPKMPDYRFTTSVAGLDLAQAIASQMKAFKDTVVGRLGFEMSGTGRSLNTAPAMENLNAKGKFKVDNAEFTSIDVGKMVAGGINGAIAQVADKVPALKGKTVPDKLPSGASRYDWIQSSFTVAKGHFDAPDFTTKASPNKGIDLKGDTNIDLKTQALHANWVVIDTYNLTHAKDLSVSQMGVQIPHVLAEGNGPVKFPITVTGTLSAPQYSYGQVADALVKVALNNATGAVKGAAKSRLQNQAQGLLKQAPPDLQNKLKGLFGG
jgi:AsmA protein